MVKLLTLSSTNILHGKNSGEDISKSKAYCLRMHTLLLKLIKKKLKNYHKNAFCGGRKRIITGTGHIKGYCSGQQSSIPWPVGIKIPTLIITQSLKNNLITYMSVSYEFLYLAVFYNNKDIF